MRVISIANFKGGTGKTTTACNLAALLARDGQRVLLIDADAQHNATDFFCEDWDGLTLTNVLEGTGEPLWSDNVAPSGYENLDLICADMGLLRLDLASILNGHNAAQRRMDDLLDVIRQYEAYDWILVDCPPSFTAASVACLVNSDEVLLPTRIDRFSRRRGIEPILRSWTEAFDVLCVEAINRLGKMNANKRPAVESGGPSRAPAPTWQTGTPPRKGRYFCQVDMGDSKPHENRCYWGDDGWSCYGSNLKANGWKVVGWWPLPEEA